MRYLILSDAAQAEPASRIPGLAKVYTVISREQAINGHAAEIAGNPVVIWPDRETILRDWGFARELALLGEVKMLDVSLGFVPKPQEMLDTGWDYAQFLEWITGQTEHAVNIVKLVSADEPNSDAPDGNPPPPEADAAMHGSEPPPDASPVDGADGPDASEPYWDVDTAPPDDYHPGLAGRVYDSPETRPEGSEWPEPLDLTRALYRGLPMPISLVPASLQPFVADNAARLGVNPGPVWFGVLGAMAGLSNDFIRLQIKQHDDWTVHPVVWPLVIGGPSSGKSPAIEVGMKWVMKKDAEIVLENTRKLKDHEHQLKIYEDDCATARKNKLPRPQEPEPPTLREYWLNNGTREGAVRMLQYSRKLCLYLDEVTGFLNSHDRYAPGGKGSGDREFWLSCFNGGSSKTSLAGRTVSVPNASIALCGGTTPSAMRQAAGGKLQADGLLARMLVCMVPDAKDEGTDTVPDAEAAATYDRILTNLIDMQHAATVRLSPDAYAIYREFCAELTKRIKAEDSDQLAGTLGKWFGVWGRLALIYFLAECATHGQVPLDGHQIPAAIAAQVTRFLWWQLTHQQQFWHETMSNKVGRKFAQLIARYILAHEELDTLNFRDHVSRPHHKALDALRPWELKECINTLISAAWITPQGNKINTYGVPGQYDINPRIKSMFESERENEKERRAVSREELQAMRNPGED